MRHLPFRIDRPVTTLQVLTLAIGLSGCLAVPVPGLGWCVAFVSGQGFCGRSRAPEADGPDPARLVAFERTQADKGDSSYQNMLGAMYEFGDGVPQDLVQADKWYVLAVAGGNQGAVDRRARVEVLMTPAQIAEARKLADEWRPTSPGAAGAPAASSAPRAAPFANASASPRSRIGPI